MSMREIETFREYLGIPSVHPNVNYDGCVLFLQKQADNMRLPIRVCFPADRKNPVVVITWTGQQPELPSILLNSHMDVVPVCEEHWTHPPFGAEMDDEGRIYARGAQDMKCVGTQYLAAVRALKRSYFQLKRTIHILFVPDEEVGGRLGMEAFYTTDEFKSLHVGFALDEGIASPTEVFPVFYAQRSGLQLSFKFTGSAGHGSMLLENTVGEKIQYIHNRMMHLRSIEATRLANDLKLTLGDVTTINLTMLSGGVQSNVIPADAGLVYDCRCSMNLDRDEFEKEVDRWCAEAGGGITVEKYRGLKSAPTPINDSNPFWEAFESTLVDDLKLKIEPQVFPGGTDARFLRYLGIPAIGFSPINNTPVRLHDHDEYLGAETYLDGIQIYKKIIIKLANV